MSRWADRSRGTRNRKKWKKKRRESSQTNPGTKRGRRGEMCVPGDDGDGDDEVDDDKGDNKDDDDGWLGHGTGCLLASMTHINRFEENSFHRWSARKYSITGQSKCREQQLYYANHTPNHGWWYAVDFVIVYMLSLLMQFVHRCTKVLWSLPPLTYPSDPSSLHSLLIDCCLPMSLADWR